MQYSGKGVKNRSAKWDRRASCGSPVFVLLHIILCLRLPEFMISARFIGDKAFMASRLHNFPAVKYGDFVTETAGCQPVADINRRFVP